ncbi:MAG: hypothetical protein QOJ88_1203 [Pyrinomonadaceae bacterium]|nr:hypothetical protein [Pyrinomonadaceae bacterium]
MSLFLRLKRQRQRHCGLAVVLVLFAVGLEAAEAEAQSGRRASKPASPASVPAATTTEIADAEKILAPGELPASVRLLVARQPTSKHLPTEDQIFASFVKHLNRYDKVDAASIGDLKEGLAVERARTETKAFVILLKFEIDSFQSGTIIMNSRDLQVEYAVLAPQTGKRQTKGKVYFQGIGGGRLRKSDWPNGTPIRITPEGAGIEAADGLYFWLKLAALRKTTP